MSKSTLSTLKSEINTEKRCASGAEATMNSLNKSILSSIDDRVGKSASESITSICNSFSYNMDLGFKGATNAVNALDNGYNKLDSIVGQGENLLAQAKSIVREIGEI